MNSFSPLAFLDHYVEQGDAVLLPSTEWGDCGKLINRSWGRDDRCPLRGRWLLPRTSYRGTYCTQHAAVLLRYHLAQLVEASGG